MRFLGGIHSTYEKYAETPKQYAEIAETPYQKHLSKTPTRIVSFIELTLDLL